MTTCSTKTHPLKMDTCAHKAGSRKEGDVTELCINSRTCTAKNGWPLFLLHLTVPPHSFAPAPINTLPTLPCDVKSELHPAPVYPKHVNCSVWRLGHTRASSPSWVEKRAGRASTISNSGLQNGLPRAESRGADGHVQGQVHRDWAQGACPGP